MLLFWKPYAIKAYKMTDSALKIHDIFRLSDGSTVIACDRPTIDRSWSSRKVRIISDGGEQRQELVVSGEMTMLRQTKRLDEIAIQAWTPVHLSVEEAQSGHWLVF